MRWGTRLEPRARFWLIVYQLQLFIHRVEPWIPSDCDLFLVVTPFVLHFMGILLTMLHQFNGMGTLALFSADAIIIGMVVVYFYHPSQINCWKELDPSSDKNDTKRYLFTATEPSQIFKEIDHALVFFTPRYFNLLTTKVFPTFPIAIVHKIVRYTHPVEVNVLCIWTINISMRFYVIAYCERQSMILRFSVNQYLNLLRWTRLHRIETSECTCWEFSLGVSTESCKLCHRYADIVLWHDALVCDKK